MICDKDCFHCPYPDCINDCMDHEDYVEAAERDRELRSTPEKRKIAAQNRAYREANREKLAAQQRAYYEANREKYAEAQKPLAMELQALGLSKAAAARMLGVSQPLICQYERGKAPCDAEVVTEKLRAALANKGVVQK